MRWQATPSLATWSAVTAPRPRSYPRTPLQFDGWSMLKIIGVAVLATVTIAIGLRFADEVGDRWPESEPTTVVVGDEEVADDEEPVRPGLLGSDEGPVPPTTTTEPEPVDPIVVPGGR